MNQLFFIYIKKYHTRVGDCMMEPVTMKRSQYLRMEYFVKLMSGGWFLSFNKVVENSYSTFGTITSKYEKKYSQNRKHKDTL